MPDYQFHTIQFLIPRAVDLALDRAALMAKGLRFETSTKSVPPTMTRVTMKRTAAPLFLEALAELSAGGKLVMECAAAGKNLNDALAL